MGEGSSFAKSRLIFNFEIGSSMISRIGCGRSTTGVGVLVAQLGTPSAPTKSALRPYLKEFLSDPRVIEKPKLFWWFILNLFILNTRPKRSARLYSRIWTSEGSPLLVITRRQTELLKNSLANKGISVPVEFGMRYGSHSVAEAVGRLLNQGCDRIVLVPMYPQYSATTTASIYDAFYGEILKQRRVPAVRVVAPFYNDILFQVALRSRIENYLKSKNDSPPERIILSYHGIPRSYVERGDSYCCQCAETTKIMLTGLSYPKERVIHTYQSRFGRDPWLQPYTDEVIAKLAQQGIKRVALFAPGFVADCLETLDELGNEAREQFLHLGGERLDLIPCVNDSVEFIEALTSLTCKAGADWFADSNQGVYSLQPCPVKTALNIS
ncbi:MAG TPA: ferrochelatase [Oligoflexia bacterium]|nr:ferrochelatase [Oligoflexia bacterium]HMP27264.1 ferrochelatase [Oligoflexia bacterium]